MVILAILAILAESSGNPDNPGNPANPGNSGRIIWQGPLPQEALGDALTSQQSISAMQCNLIRELQCNAMKSHP